MVKVIEGSEYLTATEAIEEMHTNKQHFHSNVKHHLHPYRPGGRKNPLYSRREVNAFALGKILRKGTIPITGMFEDWTQHARDLGYDAITSNLGMSITTLPEEIAVLFHVDPSTLFVGRKKLTSVEDTPICYWTTYYPFAYVQDIVPQIQQGTAPSLVEYLAEKHGVSIGIVKDQYAVRNTTLDELNLFRLANDEPVQLLQRVALAKETESVILVSDMVLLGTWFVIEREQIF